MKQVSLKLISVFEIVSGLAGLLFVAVGMTGMLSFVVLPNLWFIIFCLMSIAAGILLLVRWKYSVVFSVLLQLIQVPFIQTADFRLGFGLPFANFTVSGVWNGEDGISSTVVGVNLVALGVLLLLLWCRSALRNVPAAHAASNNGMHPTAS